MSPKPDDDALSWAGDDDASLVVGNAGRAPDAADVDASTGALPEGWTAVGKPGHSASVAGPELDGATPDGATPATPAGATASAQSSVALIGMGIFAGIYMLYIVGWYIGANRIGNPLSEPLGKFMFSFGAWLAIASPLVWFSSVCWLTTTRPRLRILWLFIGVIVLAPFPFIFGIGASV